MVGIVIFMIRPIMLSIDPSIAPKKKILIYSWAEQLSRKPARKVHKSPEPLPGSSSFCYWLNPTTNLSYLIKK